MTPDQIDRLKIMEGIHRAIAAELADDCPAEATDALAHADAVAAVLAELAAAAQDHEAMDKLRKAGNSNESRIVLLTSSVNRPTRWYAKLDYTIGPRASDPSDAIFKAAEAAEKGGAT